MDAPENSVSDVATPENSVKDVATTVKSVRDVTKLGEEEHILLCISDLEGCQDSPVLCSTNTFDAIETLMESYQNLQVAFLGDYFDQGPHIVSTINGIMKLKNSNKDKIHIILGNRDVNKMRIAVEEETMMVKPEIVWSVWKKFFNLYNEDVEDKFERTKIFLKDTYGAGLLLQRLNSNGEEINKEEIERKGLDIMCSIFSKMRKNVVNDDESFVNNCRNFFKAGKLIEKIEVGSTNVLVSHAGTYNLNMFKVKSSLAIDDVVGFKAETYFNDMENVRRALSSTILDGDLNLDEAIKFYNDTLSKVVTAMTSDKTPLTVFDDVEIYKKYLLLQAMGLKPDPNTESFISPIDSCGLYGCNNVKPMVVGFAGFLKENEISVIAHGHIPHCCTVPLIHSEEGIGFLSCDTSNGNRPKKCDDTLMELKHVPLGYIKNESDNSFAIGITSINENILTNEDTIACNNRNGVGRLIPDNENGMIGEFKSNYLPVIDSNDRSKIVYNNGIFLFKNGYNPSTWITKSGDVFASMRLGTTNVFDGGKRKTRKNRKQKTKKRKAKKAKRRTRK